MGQVSEMIGGIASAAIQARSQKNINSKTLQYNRWALEQEQNFQRQQTQWLADYNSPEHQMQRLKHAGLNPNLAYGSLGDASAQDASSPSALGANLQAPFGGLSQSFASILSAIGSYEKNVADANLSNIDSETRDLKNKQEIKTSKSQEDLNKANVELSGENSKKVKQETANLLYTARHILPKESQKLLTEAEKLYQDMVNSQRITAAECAKIKQMIIESKQNVRLSKMQSAYLGKQIKKYDEYMDAQIKSLNGSWSLSTSQAASESMKYEALQYLNSGDFDKFIEIMFVRKILNFF